MIGEILSGLGAVANVIGASGQIDQAKKNEYAGRMFGEGQKYAFEKGFTDLISASKNAPTYKGDLSYYNKVQNAAVEGKQLAGGRVAGVDRMRENVRQGTANAIATGMKGAQSSTDILALAGLSQSNEADTMRNIDVQELQASQSMQMQAQQNYLAALGQTAGAQAQQAGLEFQSEQNKYQTTMGLQQQQLQGGLQLDQQNFERNMDLANKVAGAKAALWSGIGQIGATIGGGIMANDLANRQMQTLRDIHTPSSTGNSFGGTIGDLASFMNVNPMQARSLSMPTVNTSAFSLPTLTMPK